MVLNPKLLLIIISFVFVVNTQTFEPVFDIGVYPNHMKYGINSPTCGLRYVPTVHNIKFKPECFLHNYSDQTIYEENSIRFEENIRTQTKSRIFKGKDAKMAEAPWVVFIGLKLSLKYYLTTLLCTGTLITHEWVLTAAHCRLLRGFHEKSSFLVIGGPITYSAVFGFTQGKHYRQYDKWIIHPFYDNPSLVTNSTNQSVLDNFQMFYDISLMKLAKPFPEVQHSGYEYLINPVCLPSKNKSKKEPFMVTNFAYGIIEASGLGIRNNKPEELQKAEFRIRTFGNYYYAFHNTREGEPKTCKGDSGSGIVYYLDEYKARAVYVGTVSGSKQVSEWYNIYSDCRPVEGDYTSSIPTFKFMDWILDTIANN